MATTPYVDFVLFYVSNLDESYTHFTQVLGFQPVPEGSGETFRQLRGASGPDLGLLQASPETLPAGTIALYCKTPDFEELHSAITNKGVKTSEIMHMPFGTIFNVTNPDGFNVIMQKA